MIITMLLLTNNNNSCNSYPKKIIYSTWTKLVSRVALVKEFQWAQFYQAIAAPTIIYDFVNRLIKIRLTKF